MSWDIIRGSGPLVVTAIHAGHELRPEVSKYSALHDNSRLREEDPYTEFWAELSENRIVVNTSRFEVDLNRPLHKAVYIDPDDAWGLDVWRSRLPMKVIEGSRAKWSQFYAEAGAFLDEIHDRHGHFVVLDIHSYCHRRRGSSAPFDDPWLNPEINIGTASVDRATWAPLIKRMIGDLRRFDFRGRRLDVRENVKFTGGHFARWINGRYGRNACAIAIEFKKIFMDEWTGALDFSTQKLLQDALALSLPGMSRQLEAIGVMNDACLMAAKKTTARELLEDNVEP